MSPNLLKTGSDWLADTLKAHAGTSVTYRRGGLAVDLTVTVGQSEREVEDGDGLLVTVQAHDFLILVADLVLDGQQVLPESGDLIRETTGGVTYVWEVLPPTPNEPCWRYSDPDRKALRVHTKKGRPNE